MFNIQKNYEFVFCIVLTLISIKSVSNIICPNDEINRIGIRTVCEYSFRRKQVSCLDPVKPDTKAMISCRYGYSNKENIKEQEIECTSTGRWSAPPIQCDDVCYGRAIDPKFGSNEPWYIELKIDKIICPAMILNAKLLLTSSLCILPYSNRTKDFVVKTKEPNSQILKIKMIHFKRVLVHFSLPLSVVELENNIFYNPNVRAVCTDESFGEFLSDKFQEEFILEILERFRPYKTLDYAFIYSCSIDFVKNQLTSNSNIELECFSGDKQISCDQDLDQGTVVKFRCNFGYEKLNPESSDELQCTSEGKWDRKVSTKCVQTCGQYGILSDRIPLVTNTSQIEIYNAPWHVGIYRNLMNSPNYQGEYICGGTLIDSNIVITAGHCFNNIQKDEIDSELNYMVVSGKRFRDFNSPETTKQISGIKKIHVPNTYNVNEVRHDIAVVVLKENLHFDGYTGPACVEWSQYGEYDIESGKPGLVVGWGATSPDDNFSSELLAIELKTLNNEECKNLARPNFRNQITGEKFCAIGFMNVSTCRGDSGGGFLIKKPFNYEEDRYYLWGVVSHGLDERKHCAPGFLTTFTNIQYNQEIIKSVIKGNLKPSRK